MDIFDNSMLDKEALNDSILVTTVVENLSFIDSSIDDDLPDLNGYDLQLCKPLANVHTPSPMVSRSYFNDHAEPRKNIPMYSFSHCPGFEDKDLSVNINQRNDDVVYNLQSENILPLTHNRINYRHNYSPEFEKRDTDIIFEEKCANDNNEEIENSDYSDQSQSPDNSISSNDNGSNSSSDSSSEETILTETIDKPIPESTHIYRISTDPVLDFQEIFNDINKEEFSGNIYHQPPKALDRDSATRLARRLYECDGFKITDVAKHLSKRNDFSQIVGEEFANFFDFSNLMLDKALRLFLSRFTLIGETQERERIMHHFSKRFVTGNNNLYNGEDACHTLVCALIILNTNLHSQNHPKMQCNDFILNLKDLNEGDNFPPDNLKELYSAIEQEPIRWPMDDELVGIVNMPKQELVDFSQQIIKPTYSIGLDLPRDSNCKDFMSGYVVRKWLKETGGRKAAFGKRGWKLFYGRLRDLTLYLYKDHDKSVAQYARNSKLHKSIKSKKSKSISNKSSSKLSASAKESTTSTATIVQPDENQDNCALTNPTHNTEQTDNNSKEIPANQDILSSSGASSTKTTPSLVLPPADTEIHINNAYASRALDYVKKRNVFRIKTKYGSEYLFQVNTEKEMDGWIDNINYVAALLSDPEPTISVCTMEKLSARSIPLPKITTLNVRDQLESHQRCVLELENVVSSLKENAPRRLDKRSRSELEESIKFREDELQRYKTYCQLLEYELARMQNIINIRLSSSDSPFFYQPFQMTGASPGTAHFMNPGMIVNQQMLSNLSATDNFINNTFLQSQSNIRYRPPPVHQNQLGLSANRRLRYRVPNPQNVPPCSSLDPPIIESITHNTIINQTSVPVQDSDDGEGGCDNASDSSAQTPCNTFYEIV